MVGADIGGRKEGRKYLKQERLIEGRRYNWGKIQRKKEVSLARLGGTPARVVGGER